ncbi:hypothetical protein [Prochlorococcus sp. MIT 1223]|uniref:hypothetical protein n=1 Tax=Prochlorococcus sp. MIT 1223 TaxID=3096217 RepID=UPI002A75EFE7|nr:hypothetical protein [Prochlorococcus sp. MIT 1223]
MASQKNDDKKSSKRRSAKDKSFANSADQGREQEVLLNLPAGLKYRMPGQRQRVIVGSIVIALNVLLVLSVILYFYNPAFQEFIYNVGRE